MYIIRFPKVKEVKRAILLIIIEYVLSRMRIVVGGIGHESNTFSPLLTGIEDFRVIEGDKLLKEESSKFLISEGAEVIPTLIAKAIPSGVVKKDTYMKLKERLLRGISEAGKINGVCLHLHGAMLVEEIGDGESDLVKDVRKMVGEDVLTSVSLDLHANVHPNLLEAVNIITAYRTAPHTDVKETRMRAARLLMESLKKGMRPTL